MSKLVSVYITTYNRAEKLKRTIKSVINQTYKNIEVIVVDDASSDNTKAIMKSLTKLHPKLKYIKLAKNKGANHARNIAIKEAKGFYITGLDDDDEMLPLRIEKMVEAYDDKWAFISSEHYLDYGNKRKYKRLTHKKEIAFQDMLYANLIGNQILTTKEKFIQAGLFNEEILAAQDHDMWLRLLKSGQKAKIIKEALQIIHIGHESITMSQNKFTGYWQVYQKYKYHFSREQRKYWLLNFYYWRDKKLSLKNAKKLLNYNPKYFLKSIAKMIKVNHD
jgi:glycosyltransferase involved in cell wall biosynthesis